MFGVRSVCGLCFVLGTVFAYGTAQAQTASMPQTCWVCHGEEPKYPVKGVRSQYSTSGHKNLGNYAYSNGGGCQQCHTNEGFIQFAKTGKVDDKGFIANPSEIGCFTCHSPHERGNFSLRKNDSVTLANGVAFSKEKGNLCANCHRARRTPKDEVRERNIPSDSWGAHHGPQADMLLGTNGYEFPGRTYSKSAHALLPQANCVTCHMTLPAGRYSLSPAIGGHSFNIGGEVHEEHKLNNAGCMSCHKEMKAAPGGKVFASLVVADYDGDGKIENLQEEVQGLYEKLINSKGTGLLQTMKNPPYDAQGKFKDSKSKYPNDVVAALYNYKFVQEDRSRGIHNANYAIQLLMDSIKALDKNFDESKRPK
jgi:hypothetical protein